MLPRGWRRLMRLREGADRIERDVEDEMAFHVETRIRKLIGAGLSEADARAEALRQFGDYAAVRDEVVRLEEHFERRARRSSRLHELWQDVGYALRGLRRNPGFAAAVVVSLGVGIGANTAIFTLIDALLLRELPVESPAELISVGDPTRVNSASCCTARTDLFSWIRYVELRDAVRTVSGLAASGRTGRLEVTVDGIDGGAGPVETPPARMVTGNFFEVLGVRALLGRTFTEQEDEVVNGSPAVVISHAYWRRRYSEDPGVIGRTMHINGRVWTIRGVLPRGFHGEVVGQMTDLWLPVTMQPAVMVNQPWLDERGRGWLQMIGRLGMGQTVASAAAEFNTLVHRFDAEAAPMAGVGRPEEAVHVPVQSAARGLSYIRSIYSNALTTLMVAVMLVLLMVCANVSNLLFARGARRSREIGVRMALGAGRGRVVRQLLAEGAVLAGLGGAAGLILAAWGRRALLVLVGGGEQAVPLDAGLNPRILGFTLLLTSVTALLCGLMPALRSTGTVLAGATRSSGIEGGSARSRGGPAGPARLLVMAQVALSLTLLVDTGLIVRSTRQLAHQDMGLADEELLIARVAFAPANLDEASGIIQSETLRQRLLRVPGVVAVSYSENGIFSGTESGTGVSVDGFSPGPGQDTTTNYDRVGPGYFEALGARLIAGRGIEEDDRPTGRRVAVINETMAGTFFANGDAIGRRIRMDALDYEVIGVVADTKDHGLRRVQSPRLYLRIGQTGEEMPAVLNFELRMSGDMLAAVEPVRAAVADVNPALQTVAVEPLTRLVGRSIRQDHLVARVSLFFGLLALALAVVGIYGLLSYATVRRTGEFGLRLALGAAPADVQRMVMREVIALVAVGGAAGLPLGLAGARLLRGQLFGVGIVDPLSIALAIAILGCSAAAAAWLPAVSAARTGPLVVLRGD